MELARLTIKEMRDIDRGDHLELDEYHKARRKSNEADELDALFTRYAFALSFFDRWKSRGVRTASERSQQTSVLLARRAKASRCVQLSLHAVTWLYVSQGCFSPVCRVSWIGSASRSRCARLA